MHWRRARTVPLVAACSMLLNLVIVWRLWQEVQLRLLWPFLLGAMAGVPIGVAVLHMIDAELVRRAVGLLLVAYSAYMFRLPAMPVLQMSHAGGRAADGAVGLAGGFMGGATSLNGILPTIWCGLRGWTKSEQRGVFQPYILIVHGLTLGWLGGAQRLRFASYRPQPAVMPAGAGDWRLGRPMVISFGRRTRVQKIDIRPVHVVWHRVVVLDQEGVMRRLQHALMRCCAVFNRRTTK